MRGERLDFIMLHLSFLSELCYLRFAKYLFLAILLKKLNCILFQFIKWVYKF